jgi:hypothetical protein
MPKIVWVWYSEHRYRLSDLARSHNLLPQTLASRLERGFTIERALATGVCTRSEAGRRALASKT